MSNSIANIVKSVAAASATVGIDLLQVSPSEVNARMSIARKITGLALVGSTAAGDTSIDLRVNGTKIGTYFNTSTGTTVDMSKDLQKMSIDVPANGVIEAVVTDAANTNPVVLYLFFGPGRSFRSYNRGYYRRTGTGRTNSSARRY